MDSLKYPILLVHGMGFHDHQIFNYWGRIPRKLKMQGNRIYYGKQDSHASAEDNGRFLYGRLQEILKETGAGKVNIIAHSKGGLDSRWMISHLDQGAHVASLTTIATPHHGSRTVDILMRLPDPLIRTAAFFCDCWYRMMGDRTPDSYQVFHGLTTEHMETFNRQTPDVEGVYYQSYAFVMKHIWSDLLMSLPCMVVRILEGASDGLVTPESAMWGDFQGVFTGSGRQGISHCDEVDRRRRKLSRKRSGEPGTISDIAEFYCGITERLRKLGY